MSLRGPIFCLLYQKRHGRTPALFWEPWFGTFGTKWRNLSCGNVSLFFCQDALCNSLDILVEGDERLALADQVAVDPLVRQPRSSGACLVAGCKLGVRNPFTTDRRTSRPRDQDIDFGEAAGLAMDLTISPVPLRCPQRLQKDDPICQRRPER